MDIGKHSNVVINYSDAYISVAIDVGSVVVHTDRGIVYSVQVLIVDFRFPQCTSWCSINYINKLL